MVWKPPQEGIEMTAGDVKATPAILKNPEVKGYQYRITQLGSPLKIGLCLWVLTIVGVDNAPLNIERLVAWALIQLPAEMCQRFICARVGVKPARDERENQAGWCNNKDSEH